MMRKIRWALVMGFVVAATAGTALNGASGLALAADPPGATPAPPADPPSDAPAAPPTDDEIRETVKRTDDTVSGVQSVLTRLQRTQISGYLQARSVYSEEALPQSNLFVRRARLNVRHSWDRGFMALSFDGGQNVVTVKDAYLDWAMVKGEGQRQGLVARAGQFFRTFGFELERSESAREFLERSAAYDILFPGNRDQGFDLSYGITPALVVNGAVMNGGGTSVTNLSFRDSDDRKDFLARVRYSFFGPRADIALSFYDGEQVLPAVAAVPAVYGFVDANTNGRQDAGEDTVVVSAAKAGSPAIEGSRDRWGVSLNVYDLLGGTVRGEYIVARDLTLNRGTDPRQAEADAVAWFVQYVHALPADFNLGARYDRFDPDTDDTVRPGGDGEQRVLGVVLNRTFGDNLTLTVLYEHQELDTYDRMLQVSHEATHDPVTFQMQYAF